MTKNVVNKKDTSTEEMSLELTVPEEKQVVNVEKSDFDIDGFLDMRKQFITKVNKIMVKGSDYHEIQNKKSLAKGGAEKIASIFGWTAQFEKDSATIEAFGETKGLIAFVCNLSKNNEVVGQGRGAATLQKNASDPNKTIKMAQKSAFIDAVLRASGLSDFFTQDLEDHPEHLNSNEKMPHTDIQPSPKQIEFIQNLMEQKRVDEAWVIDQGFDLKHLTGGKGGTASELIEFLKTYIPEQAVTRTLDESGVHDLTQAAEGLMARLEVCFTEKEAAEIAAECKIAMGNGKITKYDMAQLIKKMKELKKELDKDPQEALRVK